MKLRGFIVYGHSICRILRIRHPTIEHTSKYIHLPLRNTQPHSQSPPILYGADYFPDDVLRHFPSYHIFLICIQQYT